MDLVELLGNRSLEQDEWTLEAPVFGDKGQLKVVGWCHPTSKLSRNKLYISKCSVCSNDPELFGEGYFSSRKSNILRGQLPCGCSVTQWSKKQYYILCSRKAEKLGHRFIDFVGEWKGKKTKIKMICEKHGEWSSGRIDALLKGNRTCPACRCDAVSSAVKKPDDEMIASFLSSGGFHPETRFWRSDRKDNRGTKSYWYVNCPDCGETVESPHSSLKNGSRSCMCGSFRQQQAYINLVLDGSSPIALKFGIANNSNRRLKRQQSYTYYILQQHAVYNFPSVTSCKQAERECRQELECGVVLKRDMPDGWSETTYVYNLEKIVEIYKRNGGHVLQPTLETFEHDD